MLTEFQKQLYNKWLAVSRSMSGRPFRLRKQWKGFEEKPEYVYIKKLANRLGRYDNIDIDEYFKAPYRVYKDDNFTYPLEFYITLKAITCYKIHTMKTKNLTEREFKKLITKKQVD